MLISGTMQKLNYGPFDGTIQALTVTENHMLLTFCIDHLFSIILTREPKILAIEVRFNTDSKSLCSKCCAN